MNCSCCACAAELTAWRQPDRQISIHASIGSLRRIPVRYFLKQCSVVLRCELLCSMEFKCSKCPGLIIRSQGEKKKHKNYHKDIDEEQETVKGDGVWHGEAVGGGLEAVGGELEVEGDGQEAGGSDQEAEGGGQEAKGGGQEAVGGDQEVEGNRQEAAGSDQEAEGGGQEAEGIRKETWGEGELVNQVFV